MKIEQLIVQYLYSNKQVTLQGIGTFKLDPSVILPAENDKEKDFVMPENAFHFEYNLKAEEDNGLINYIVQHTRKILPLASADLDSYAILAKQFLNIGKPLIIEGVGTVQKNQQGSYQFIPGNFITPKIEEIPRPYKDKKEENVSFESEGTANNSRRNLMVAITILVLVLVGLGIYYFVSQRQAGQPGPAAVETAATDPVAGDTGTSVKQSIDTSLKVDIPVAPLPKTDSFNFKIVLKKYTSEDAAQKAFKRLTTYGHKLLVLKSDSTGYELAIPFKTALSDTIRAKDSLRRFFGGNPYIKL